MSDPKQARMLLDTAARDLSALRGMEDASVFADEIFGFHAQQVVEKSFKAWLALLGEIYPITHDLARLLEELRKHDLEAVQFRDLTKYTQFAAFFRCPVFKSQGEPLDRAGLLPHVEALLGRVRRLLESVHENDARGAG